MLSGSICVATGGIESGQLLWYLPIERHEQGDGVFCDGVRGVGWHPCDFYSEVGGVIDIDSVIAGTTQSDQFDTSRVQCIQYLQSLFSLSSDEIDMVLRYRRCH